MSSDLEHLIRTHIPLPHTASSGGWYQVLCKVCNDHGRKGPRAAFRFDTNSVGYNCFNCGAKAVYDETSQKKLSDNFRSILIDFGVPEDEINRLALSQIQTSHAPSQQQQPSVQYQPAEIQLPSHFYELNDDKWSTVAREYLQHIRHIDPDSYPFLLSTGIPLEEDLSGKPESVQIKMIEAAEKWKGRLIIPVFKDNKLIYYTGRDLTGKKERKYLNPGVAKSTIMFGFDQLFTHTSDPLYIVEGIFDAMLIDGVAILGRRLSQQHIYWLNKSNREKVYIPDRLGEGDEGARQAIKLGWSLSFPDIRDCKDITDGVDRYGKLYVLSTIKETTTNNKTAARVQLSRYCK